MADLRILVGEFARDCPWELAPKMARTRWVVRERAVAEFVRLGDRSWLFGRCYLDLRRWIQA